MVEFIQAFGEEMDAGTEYEHYLKLLGIKKTGEDKKGKESLINLLKKEGIL